MSSSQRTCCEFSFESSATTISSDIEIADPPISVMPVSRVTERLKIQTRRCSLPVVSYFSVKPVKYDESDAIGVQRSLFITAAKDKRFMGVCSKYTRKTVPEVVAIMNEDESASVKNSRDIMSAWKAHRSWNKKFSIFNEWREFVGSNMAACGPSCGADEQDQIEYEKPSHDHMWVTDSHNEVDIMDVDERENFIVAALDIWGPTAEPEEVIPRKPLPPLKMLPRAKTSKGRGDLGKLDVSRPRGLTAPQGRYTALDGTSQPPLSPSREKSGSCTLERHGAVRRASRETWKDSQGDKWVGDVIEAGRVARAARRPPGAWFNKMTILQRSRGDDNVDW